MNFDNILSFVEDAATTFQGVYETFNTPLKEFPQTGLINIIVAHFTPLGNMTIIEMMLAGGVTLFIGYTLIKWFIDLI